MHLAFALFRYFPFGGMQRDMLATARRCVERGHRVTIYCHTWQGEQPHDLDVQVVKVLGNQNHVRARRFDRALQQQLFQTNPDRVIGFDKLSGLDLYFAADPCFVTRTAHRSWLYRLTPRFRTFRKLEAAVFQRSTTTRILLLAEGERDHYQRIWQTPTERFVTLPPGIALDRRKGRDADSLRQAARAELGIGEHEQLVLLLAANFELKGIDRAMLAVAALPDAMRQRTHLLAVGQAPEQHWQQLAAKSGIEARVRMVPGTVHIPPLLQAADVLLHPARRDTTGTVLLEALVAGLPAICTATCGYAHHIETAGCGRVLKEPFAQQELNDSLRDLLGSDPTSRQAAALRYAQQNDLHSMHDVICRAIEA